MTTCYLINGPMHGKIMELVHPTPVWECPVLMEEGITDFGSDPFDLEVFPKRAQYGKMIVKEPTVGRAYIVYLYRGIQ